jgi:hypothetical protein
MTKKTIYVPEEAKRGEVKEERNREYGCRRDVWASDFC